MCPKTPKVKPTVEKKPQYLRNPFLDGLAFGSNTGRNALRVDLGSQTPVPYQPPAPTPGLVVPNSKIGFQPAGGGRGGRNMVSQF